MQCYYIKPGFYEVRLEADEAVCAGARDGDVTSVHQQCPCIRQIVWILAIIGHSKSVPLFYT